MGLVNAKCTNCGAVLKIDNAKEAAICEYCGSPFIIEKAILNFNVGQFVNNTINAETVNIFTASSDFAIEAGVLKQYKGESLTVRVPDNVKRSQCVFPAGVTEVYYPDSVLSVNDKWPDSIQTVRLPSGLTSLAEGCFADCARLAQVVLPKSLKIIGKECFKNCKSLQTIDLPQGVEHIGESAFYDSGLTEIVIPDTVKSIGRAAFGRTHIKHVDLPAVPECIQTFIGCDDLESVTFAEGLQRMRGTFYSVDSIVDVNIPRSVTRIDGAFYFCHRLTKIFVPSTVQTVTAHSFDDCPVLTICCEATKRPKGWDRKWDKDVYKRRSSKKVLWGVTEQEFKKL